MQVELYKMVFLLAVFALYCCSLHVKACNETLTYPSGVITSPNYPAFYNDSIYCTYELYSPFGYIINLRVEEVEFECCAVISDCDYLEIYNGSETTQYVDRFCSNGVRTYSSQQFFLVFRTDLQGGDIGFKMLYSWLSR
ncbi:protein SpAN-like [Biomphalaria glabrata]|uniref:Protein SpAN-like n=1 Tax=Biomphalaria glabrata TaxID=6526 RepID=A0A9W3AJ99_BIOGL|nr:protein SpAN-like [Biomphalaria glabrata]